MSDDERQVTMHKCPECGVLHNGRMIERLRTLAESRLKTMGTMALENEGLRALLDDVFSRDMGDASPEARRWWRELSDRYDDLTFGEPAAQPERPGYSIPDLEEQTVELARKHERDALAARVAELTAANDSLVKVNLQVSQERDDLNLENARLREEVAGLQVEIETYREELARLEPAVSKIAAGLADAIAFTKGAATAGRVAAQPEHPMAEDGSGPTTAAKVYVCSACGKASPTREPTCDSGWDESCMLHAVLCYAEKDETGHWVAVSEAKSRGGLVEPDQKGGEPSNPGAHTDLAPLGAGGEKDHGTDKGDR